MFTYFSELLGKPVFDKDGKDVGLLYDLIMQPAQLFPRTCALILKNGALRPRYSTLPWQKVAESEKNCIRLSVGISELDFSRLPEDINDLALRRDVLDQQVVDTYNHKVIRINDIHLLAVEKNFIIAHVDIGTRGLLRRLGFEKIADALLRFFNKKAHYLKEEHLISWKHIQPLAINPVSMTIKLDVPQEELAKIHAADLTDIFLDLPLTQQIAFFKSLDTVNRARIFMNLDFKTQKSMAEELEDIECANLLKNIPSDEAVDFLEKLPDRHASQLLGMMGGTVSRRLSQLLGYESDTAGGLMTSDYLAVESNTTIEEVIQFIRNQQHRVEQVQYVYIVDQHNHLVGSTNYRRIMLADPKTSIETIRFNRTYSVHIDSSVKDVAYLMEKYKYNAIPVVDDAHLLQGIITVDDILEQLIAMAWRRMKRVKALSAEQTL